MTTCHICGAPATATYYDGPTMRPPFDWDNFVPPVVEGLCEEHFEHRLMECKERIK